MCEKGMGWKKNHIRIKDAYVKPIKMGRRHRSRRRRCLAAPPWTGPMWRRYDVRWKHFFSSDFFFSFRGRWTHHGLFETGLRCKRRRRRRRRRRYKYDKIFVRVSSERDENNIITDLVTLWRLKHNSEADNVGMLLRQRWKFGTYKLLRAPVKNFVDHHRYRIIIVILLHITYLLYIRLYRTKCSSDKTRAGETTISACL